MIRKSSLLFLFCLAASLSFAQTKTSLKGVLADKTDHKGIGFTTVSLMDTASKVAKANTFSNEQGKFSFENLAAGTYYVAAYCVGYKPLQSEVIQISSQSRNLDTLFMEKSSQELSAVTVIAEKPLLEVETDKMVYNVANDQTLLGMTALDALKKLPFVSVDGEDNIQVKGSSNFRVLLNGKSTSIVAKNPSEALKAFPAGLIKKIEVITEPSAKYDADGTAGIINIITHKKVVGYNGNVYSSFSTRGRNDGGASFNLKKGKLGFSSYFGGNMYKYVRQTTSELNRINKTPGYRSFLNQFSEGNGEGNWYWGNMELAYDFDTLHTLSIYATPNGGSNSGSNIQTTEILDSNNVLTEKFTNNGISESKSPSFDIGIDFSKKFRDNEEHEMSFSALRQIRKDNSSYTTLQDYSLSPDLDINNTNHSKNVEHTFNVDYSKPFKNKITLESGTKMILRHLVSDYRMLKRTTAFEDYTEVPSNTNTLEYDQNVGSLYSTMAFPWKKYKLKFGARVEQTWINASFNADSLPIKNEYLNFIPTAGISRKIKESHTLKLNYSKRIQRPWMYYLNPYVNNQNPRSINYGNPDLLPEITHSITFSWNYFFKQKSLDISLSNSLTDDVITSFTTLDTNDVSYTSYFNIAKSNTIGVNISFSGMLFGKLQIWANVRSSYLNITHKLDESRNRSGFSHNAYGNFTWNFKKGYSASLGGWVWQGAPTLQSVRPLNYNYNLAMRKAFFKKKLNLGIVANNFLEKKQILITKTEDPTFYSASTYTNNLFRYYSISASFNFGKLRENVSRKKGVGNDDIKGEGG